MAGTSTTRARLRTKTGCLNCRRRQKKCDERKPICSGCARNELACSWPTESQMLDRRSGQYRNQHQPAIFPQPVFALPESHNVPTLVTCTEDRARPIVDTSDSPSDTNTDGHNLALQGTMMSDFESSNEYELFKYFAYSVLPSLIQPGSWETYSDQTYMIAMGLAFPPLKRLMVGLALIHPASGSRNSSTAVRHYLSSISSLRETVAQGNLTGTEDYLLAMTMCFCVFENCRVDTLPQVRAHVKAFAALFRLRTPKPALSNRQMLLFDRTAVESFVYYATLLMLFDPGTDSFQDQWFSDKISHYFTGQTDMDELPGSPSAEQPVLGASYKFFFFIADVTRLAISENPVSEQSQTRLTKLELDLFHWEEIHRQRHDEKIQNPLGKLYLLAVRVLLLQSREHYVDVQTSGLAHHLALCYRLGVNLVNGLQVNPFFTVLYIWPLSVLGSMALCEGDRAVFVRKIAALRQGGHTGLTAWGLRRLRHIWIRSQRYPGESHEGMMKGLRMLIRGESLDQAALTPG